MELSFHKHLKKFVFSKTSTQKYWSGDALLKAEKEAADKSKLTIKRQLRLYGFLVSSTVPN